MVTDPATGTSSQAGGSGVAGGSSGDSLANTGANNAPMLAAGGVLLLLGVIAIAAVSRSRRKGFKHN